MAQYLRMQQGGMDPSLNLDEVAGSVYFHMWRRRQDPFMVLEEGDTIYSVDGKSRTILWEFRVANLYRGQYDSQVDAFRRLDSTFGVSPADCNDYVWTRPPEGWLIAFGVDIISQLSIPLPDGLNFVALGGRNGWVSLDKLDEKMLSKMSLPKPGGKVLAPSADRTGPGNDGSHRDPERPDRAIASGVKKLVMERDGRKCGMCGDDSEEMVVHFDHIYPWSKGGPNTASNLQILCARCNIRKGAKILPGVERPDDVIDVVDWRTELDLIRSLRSRSTDGDATAAFSLAGYVPDDEAADLLAFVMESGDESLQALAAVDLAFIEVTRDNHDEAVHLAEIAHSGGDEEAAAQAALILALTTNETDPRHRQLLEQARTSQEPNYYCQASLALSSYEANDSDGQEVLLREAMKCPDRDIRAEAALFLAEVTDDVDERIDLLYEAFGSSEDQVSENAMIGLAVEYYNRDWITPVEPLLRQAAQSTDPDLAEEATELLGRLEI